MKLVDAASILRSKNAGPFTLTLDILFPSGQELERVLRGGRLTPAAVAGLYGVREDDVRIVPFPRARAIKIALPRCPSSGSPGDRDVYGCQQHVPLGELEI